jgi:hypothetical protein
MDRNYYSMKITGNQGLFINISAGRESISLLKNVNPGDLISAAVIHREGHKALLEIGGKVITAEFTNGVPQDKIINLILTAKSSEKIVFTLKENETADKVFKHLSIFSMQPEEEFKKISLQNFARYINTGRSDLMDINLFLLGLKKDRGKEKKDVNLFRNLLQKGIPHQTLIDLSYILYSRYNPVLFQAYQFLLNITGKNSTLFKKNDPDSIKEAIDTVCEYLEDDTLDFSVMFDLLFDDHENNNLYGGIALPDNENFSNLEYVLLNNSIFLKFELSSTGIMEVFIRSDKESVLINFLSEKDDVIQFIEENEVVLKNMLEQKGIKKSIIGYYNTKKVVDKINLWCLNFYTKSKFNVKA